MAEILCIVFVLVFFAAGYVAHAARTAPSVRDDYYDDPEE